MTIAEPSLTAPARPMLLDQLVPDFDATRIEHRVLQGSVPDVYARVLQTDFIRAWRDSAAVRTLFAARAAAEEVAGRLLGRHSTPPPDLESMKLSDMPGSGQYIRLGEDPPHEFTFGMIGRFWSGETSWLEIDARDFAGFAQPGLAKIGCNFSLRPYGAERTLVSYEARTRALDPDSRRQFLRYWTAVSPGVGIVMRAMLRTAAAGEGR